MTNGGLDETVGETAGSRHSGGNRPAIMTIGSSCRLLSTPLLRADLVAQAGVVQAVSPSSCCGACQLARPQAARGGLCFDPGKRDGRPRPGEGTMLRRIRAAL